MGCSSVEALGQQSEHLMSGVSGTRILLAEDNLINQKLAARILEKMGNRVSLAPTGKKAFEMVQEEYFDLVFMDVQMPEMDGYAATGAIREWEKSQGRHIPIIAMTANAMKGDRELCLEIGMDGYVAKPINQKEVQDAMQQVMLDLADTQFADSGHLVKSIYNFGTPSPRRHDQ